MNCRYCSDVVYEDENGVCISHIPGVVDGESDPLGSVYLHQRCFMEMVNIDEVKTFTSIMEGRKSEGLDELRK